MRLIDADAFDRRLANAELTAALNDADDSDRPFEREAMYYSTQSFRDVMRCQPTIDAIPVEWLETMLDKTATRDVELNNAIFTVLVAWEREKPKEGT